MAVTVVLTEITTTASGGRIVRWGDGFSQDFASLEALLDWAHMADTGPSGVETGKQFCVGYAAARDPDLSDYQSVRNKKFIVDLESPSPIKVQ